MLETVQHNEEVAAGEIFLPMSQSDISAYVGISPEAVSRCLRELARRQVIIIRGRRHIQIIDRPQLDAIIEGNPKSRG
jgi:CRP/FNR family transcriptional regulator